MTPARGNGKGGMMENNILTSVKKQVGLGAEYTPFDMDIVMDINAAFAHLHQIGAGPSDGFSIEDDTALWTDYTQDKTELMLAQTYVFLKVRLLFDPPASSAILESINSVLKETEWRLSVNPLNEGGDNDG